MKVSIKSWETENLRCPDMKVDLMLDGKLPRVSLIQMPNGTAKSTLLELMQICLSGSELKPEQVKDFKDPTGNPLKGFFELVLSLHDKSKKGDISMKLFFDFQRNSYRYQTNNSDFKDEDDISSGVDNVYNPPNELRPYLQKQIIELFIMSGNKVERLMSESTGASEAIEAFTGQFLLKNLSTETEQYYRSRVGGKRGGHTDDAKKRAKALEKSLEDQQKNLKKKLSDSKTDKAKADELKEAAAAKLDGLGSEDEQYKRAKDELDDALIDLTKESISARNMMANPFFISDVFSEKMIQFKENLEKLKLPSNTSSEFFIELADDSNKTCICGTEMTNDMRNYLLDHKEDYLSASYTSILNAVKGQIDLMSANADEIKDEQRWDKFEQAKTRYDKALTAYTRVVTLKQKDPQGRFQKARDDEIKYSKISEEKEKFIKLIEKNITGDEAKQIEKAVKNGAMNTLTSLPLCEKLFSKAQKDRARIEGNLSLLNAKEAFINILNDSLKESSQNITSEVMKMANKKLSILTKNDPVNITSLEGNIETNNGRKVSQGQSLASAYSFTTSLLERSANEFPLLIDHPFEGLQASTRKSISKFIPDICHQFIGFIIDSEKTSTLWDQNNINKKTGFRDIKNLDIDYKTIFRITDTTRHLAEAVPKESKIETRNCIITSDEDYFNEFQFEDEEAK